MNACNTFKGHPLPVEKPYVLVFSSHAWEESPLLVTAALCDILASLVSSFITTVSAWYLIPVIALTLALLELSLRGVRLAPYLMGGLFLLAAIGHAATLELAHRPVVILELVAVALTASPLVTRGRRPSIP